MPDHEFTLAPGTNNWTQDFAWDPLKDEIFMTRNIRTSACRRMQSGSPPAAHCASAHDEPVRSSGPLPALTLPACSAMRSAGPSRSSRVGSPTPSSGHCSQAKINKIDAAGT